MSCILEAGLRRLIHRTMQQIIRDHVEGFTISAETLAKFPNEFNTLGTLYAGLDFLNAGTKKAEVELGIEPGVGLTVFGRLAGMQEFAGLPLQLIECSFHWYAVSACNYLTLLGWIRQQANTSAPTPAEYVRAVIPQVLAFRNKIGAHLAQSYPEMPKGRDNPAERIFSTFPLLGFSDGRFVSPAFGLHVRKGSTAHGTEALQSWSLTGIHESLTQRFNPQTPTVSND